MQKYIISKRKSKPDSSLHEAQNKIKTNNVFQFLD